MSVSDNLRKTVRPLPPEVARKIAAGEVIDRPCAIVRELMDNAVDSGADRIRVEITDGGIENIRVSDNGCGMTKEDLLNCARPHATSKISSETDLLNLSTLGFRGEALASMCAVSRLEITSGGYRMNASVTEDHVLTPAALTEGTIVQTSGLFENFPARRRFLKRPASEALLCKTVFEEKVIPRPDLSFTLTVDGKQKFNLPENQTLTERFVQAIGISEPESLFYEIKGKGNDFSFTLVIGEPSVYRDQRKLIYIYVNGRKIQEYALMQAIEYGCQGYFPNGTHPVAALFVDIDSSLVDFNIHPAKKEARFKDINPLHHCLSTTVRNFFRSYTLKNIVNAAQENDSTPELAFENFRENDTTSVKEYFSREKIAETTSKDISMGDWRSKFFGGFTASPFDASLKTSGTKLPDVSSSEDDYDPKLPFVSLSEDDSDPKLPNVRSSTYNSDTKLTTGSSSEDNPDAKLPFVSSSEDDSDPKLPNVRSSTYNSETKLTTGSSSADNPDAKLPFVSSSEDDSDPKLPNVRSSTYNSDTKLTTGSSSEDDSDPKLPNVRSSTYNSETKLTTGSFNGNITSRKNPALYSTNHQDVTPPRDSVTTLESSGTSVENAYRTSADYSGDITADKAVSQSKNKVHFIGTTMNCFLLAEKNSILYIIDQHAADERNRFNQIMETKGQKQNLLVPYTIETDSESDDEYLEEISEILEEAGFTVKNCGEGKWEFYSVPLRWKGTETDLAHDLLDRRISPMEIIRTIAASTACRSAVMDGHVLDSQTAAQLAETALNLPDPHCPHGRPVYTCITKDQLFSLVKRT